MKIKHIVSETDWSDVIGGGLNLARDAYGAYRTRITPSDTPLVKDDTGIGYSTMKDGSWYAVDGPNKGKKVSPEKEKEIIALLARNEQTPAATGQPAQAVQRPTQQTVSIGGQTLDPNNPSHAKIIAQANQQHAIPKAAQQTPAAIGQPAQAVQRPTQQTVKIGGQTLYPYNPSHAKIIAQANQQHAIPKAAPAPTQKPKYKPDGRGGFTRISERADFSAMLLRKLRK